MTDEIRRLTRELVASYLEGLLLMDKDTEGEAWGQEQFLLDLPGKWICSRLALTPGGRAAGFAIASIKEETVHVHRLVVDVPHRGRGLGTDLLRAVAHAAQSFRVRRMTLKVARANETAIGFYRSLGFVVQENTPANLSLTLPLESLTQKGPSHLASEEPST